LVGKLRTSEPGQLWWIYDFMAFGGFLHAQRNISGRMFVTDGFAFGGGGGGSSTA